MNYTHKTTAPDGLFLRLGPGINFPKICLMPVRTPLVVASTTDGWHKLNLAQNMVLSAAINGMPVDRLTIPFAPEFAYCFAGFTEAWAEDPPPEPAQKYRLGVHVIGDKDAATSYISKGAPYIVMMHDALGGFQRATMMRSLGRPNDRMVIRPWFGWIPSVQDVVNWVGPHPDNPPVVVVGSNEGDRGSSLIDRARFDYELATELRMRQPNIEYACMSSAHGNEDYTNPEVCKIIATHYAPHYNSGLFRYVDQHNYTFQKSFSFHPPADARMVGPEWFERRGIMLIEKCGFRPDKVGIVNTEAGVEAGHGGFRWAGYTVEQFNQWLDLYLERMNAPFVFNGVTYPSPFAFGTLFVGGKDANWSGGYSVDDLLPTTREMALASGLRPGTLPASVAKYLPRQYQVVRAISVNDPNIQAAPSAEDYALSDTFMRALEDTWRR